MLKLSLNLVHETLDLSGEFSPASLGRRIQKYYTYNPQLRIYQSPVTEEAYRLAIDLGAEVTTECKEGYKEFIQSTSGATPPEESLARNPPIENNLSVLEVAEGTEFIVGDLVKSDSEFSGFGKIVSMDYTTGVASVAFFESPVSPHSRSIDVNQEYLERAVLADNQIIYLQDEETKIWRQARYGGQRPDSHLIFFQLTDFEREERDSTEIQVLELSTTEEIYVLNLEDGSNLAPLQYLQGRCCTAPWLAQRRFDFVSSYVEQRAACKSISSILSSSIEIEEHQIAVVRRVLEDDTRKYLLADEVGLGKTIEACLIVREHVLREQDANEARVLIATPSGLVEQWREELTNRFYLGDLLTAGGERPQQIYVIPHEDLAGELESVEPTMLVIDEAHLIAPWAWTDNSELQSQFKKIAKATAGSSDCLLLSGTPLSGNEENFLAMLHLLAPQNYGLTAESIEGFKELIKNRERLGGMYQALVEGNSDEHLSETVEQISELYPGDNNLQSIVEEIKPLINWLDPRPGEERTQIIKRLRAYLGENYCLHKRLLRNRREHDAISVLFPGLAGVSIAEWELGETGLSIDQLLDECREIYGGTSQIFASKNLTDWLKLYLTSPCLVTRQAEELLVSDGANLSEGERNSLKELIDCGKAEQFLKDRAFTAVLLQWLREHPTGKAIVFCSHEDVADEIYLALKKSLSEVTLPSITKAERHRPPIPPSFQEDEIIRILICDKKGEDGLNLHGGERLIIHYSMPLSCSRIEQRNGRVNRYSPALVAKRIDSIVLGPASKGLAYHWIKILDEGVGIFNRSIAALQYILQDHIDKAWKEVKIDGIDPLNLLRENLKGPNGLLETERKKIVFQEHLNSMDQDVADAKSFSEELKKADVVADEQSRKMLNWITQVLGFKKIPGEVEGSFRFRYKPGKTLISQDEFISRCLTGVDRDASEWRSIVTTLMSSDRMLISHGQQVYPMRFGQPFVDTLFELSRTDTRGICSAWIRRLCSSNRPESVDIYFCFTWIVTNRERNSEPYARRLADEHFPPKVYRLWLDGNGTVVPENLEKILGFPYSKDRRVINEDINYQDIKVEMSRWPLVETHFPDWSDRIREIRDKSEKVVEEAVDRYSSRDGLQLLFTLEMVSAVVLFSTPS